MRLRVLLHGRDLNERLLAGARPGESPELALRAGRLVAPRARAAIALSVVRAMEIAEGRRAPAPSMPPLALQEIRLARDELRRLAQVLSAEGTVRPGGVVIARRLVTDGAGPLYIEPHEVTLWKAAREAIEALEGPAPAR